jgi:hypothetical protein
MTSNSEYFRIFNLNSYKLIAHNTPLFVCVHFRFFKMLDWEENVTNTSCGAQVKFLKS